MTTPRVAAALEELRAALLEELLGTISTTLGSAAGSGVLDPLSGPSRGSGRGRGTTATAGTKARPKGAKRTQEELAEQAKTVLAFVKKNPGSRAEHISKGTGIDPTRENLRDPEKNVTIGSRFLGHLYKTFKRFTILIPTGYNAGPGYVKRALRLRGTYDADEFVESIADDQARNYTKRVTGSYFTYSWLYEKTIPEMPNTFPKDVLPK